MTRGTRIVAIDAGTPESAPVEQQVEVAGEEPLALEEAWEEEAAPLPRRSQWTVAAAVLAFAAVAGWTALFVLANQAALAAGGTPAQWTVWVRDWSIPILLVAVLWLVTMRNSRREAHRFGAAARLLGDESTRLEQRLTTINSELSLAREFLTAQSRDLDALGRLATERLSQHSEQLASLIHDNGARLDTIGTVSTSALDNMERLRGQLPVIASAAKDVTNNIATAGRTARSQLEEMVQGFNRLNQFGQASERQVLSLRQMIDEALAEFTRQSEQLETIATQRFAALASSGEEFRTQLDNHEIEALAAIRTRAKAMGDELEQARGQLDNHEAESLSSLRARLTAVRDESSAISRSLREGENTALEAWRNAVTQLEDDLGQAIAKVGEIDEQAMEAARKRLTALAAEADELDARMAERDRMFVEEVDKRRADFEARHSEFSERLVGQMAALDSEIDTRRAVQEGHSRQLTLHSETIAAQLEQFSTRMQEIAAQGGEAEAAIAASLTALAEKLTASREALSGTDTAIAGLTDSSVRLLELIRASVEHSSTDLPTAIGIGETRLIELEGRTAALRALAEEAQAHGAGLSDYVIKSHEGLTASIQQVQTFHADFTAKADSQVATVTELRESLDAVRQESLALADQAQGQLSQAIDQLNTSARDAVAGIEEMSATAIRSLAARLGDESREAIDKAMRARAAEVAGQLEQATAHAAGVSREATVQLRDQLAKVSELAGNLERRVAHARSRAEEQVDNDFARRVALITESLNSNAIDIARAMDVDVSDTSWASYLKGDRGIFTRRAVRLLDTGEAKAVAQLYDDDRGFRDNVSRYIHDFEAMLRQLLSTRDGHALGVTLLSSDMGKLYVALAQAIERLRN